jgi:putative membrane protein
MAGPRWLRLLLFLIGVALLAALLAYTGDPIGTLRAAAGVGWALLPLLLLHGVQLYLSGLAWRSLLPETPARPSALAFLGLRWVREGVNSLLPVAQIGGEVATGLRLAARVPGPLAAAATALDLALEFAGQIGFTALGLALVLMRPEGAGLGLTGLGSLCIAVGALVTFLALQRSALLRHAEQFVLRLLRHQQGSEMGAPLHAALRQLHRRYRAVAGGTGLHLLSWSLGAGEVWIALTCLGHPVGWQEAFIIESLGQAVRSIGFAIPGALGVQEGGLIAVAGLFGVPAEIALALSFVKRFREIAVGLPALAAWYWEGLPQHRRATTRPRYRPQMPLSGPHD